MPHCRYHNVTDALAFAVAVILAAIPLALEIVVTSTLALGSRKLAQEGAIVTRLAAIEDLSGMNILCSDKTGAHLQGQSYMLATGAVATHGSTCIMPVRCSSRLHLNSRKLLQHMYKRVGHGGSTF